jgi:hemolysin III
MAKVRDFVSGLTHCIGAGLSLIGLPILIVTAALNGDAYDIVSYSLFGTSLLLLYLFSTLYHWLNISEKKLNVFRKFDHIMIYIVIACSYTPVCIGPLRGPWGWSIFGVVWGLAVLGTVLSAIWIRAPRALTTTIYIAMGWLVIIFIFPLIKVYKEAHLFYSLWWLLIGGIFYTIGGIIYWRKWPRNKILMFGFHEIFHVFVMLGSFCQYWFILNYVWKI